MTLMLLAVAWLLTYLVHSTILLTGAAVLCALKVIRSHEGRDVLWKVAVLGGLVSATASSMRVISRLRSVLPGVDEALHALQIARGDFTFGEQMADQRRDVAPEQPVGESGHHRTTDVLLRYERAVHEVSAFRPPGGEPGLFEPRQEGGDGREGQPALGLQGRVHVGDPGLAGLPQHPHDVQLQLGQLEIGHCPAHLT